MSNSTLHTPTPKEIHRSATRLRELKSARSGMVETRMPRMALHVAIINQRLLRSTIVPANKPKRTIGSQPNALNRPTANSPEPRDNTAISGIEINAIWPPNRDKDSPMRRALNDFGSLVWVARSSSGAFGFKLVILQPQPTPPLSNGPCVSTCLLPVVGCRVYPPFTV